VQEKIQIKDTLDAALKSFSEYGREGAKVRMIAQKARMSVGRLYLYEHVARFYLFNDY
jgi:AcrR family transcriptional regulator